MPSLTKLYFDEKHSLIEKRFKGVLSNLYFEASLDDNEKLLLSNINASVEELAFLEEKAEKLRKLKLNVTVDCSKGIDKASLIINTSFTEVLPVVTLASDWDYFFKEQAVKLIKETVKGLDYSSPDKVMVLHASPDANATSVYAAVEALKLKGLDVTLSKAIGGKGPFFKISINNVLSEELVDRFYNPQKNADTNNNNNDVPENKVVEIEMLLKKIIVGSFEIKGAGPIEIFFHAGVKADFFNSYAGTLSKMGLKIQQASPVSLGGYFRININNSLDEALNILRAATSTQAQTMKMQNVK